MSRAAAKRPPGERPPTRGKPVPAEPAAAKRPPAKRPPTREKPVPGERQTPELAELGQAFRQVFRALSRLRGRDTHLGGSELSHAQFELLIELDERGELSAGELAAAARLTPATVTQMLDHLAACGHVQRLRSRSDRRVVVTRLTPQGRAQIEAKRAAWQGRWQRALEGVGVRDLRAATRVLARLAVMFEETSPAGGCEASESPLQAGSRGER